MNDTQLLLTALAEVRDDVDFVHETRLVENGIIDSLDLTQNSAEGMLALVRRYRQP